MFQQSAKRHARQQAVIFLCSDTERCLGFVCLTVFWLFKISILGNNGKTSPKGRKSQSTHDYLQIILLAVSSLGRDKSWWTPAACLREMQGATKCRKCNMPLAIFQRPKHNLHSSLTWWALSSHSLLCAGCAKLLPVSLSAYDTIMDTLSIVHSLKKHLKTVQSAVLKWTKNQFSPVSC